MKNQEESGAAEVELLSITPNAERLIEEAGRTCYLSFEKMTDDSAKRFIQMLVKSGHHSVLEHASATFRIKGGSRAFTHQLVRHRLASFSQQSQRYVSEEDFKVVTPPSIASNPEALKVFREAMEQSRIAYSKLKGMDIRKEDARFVLPNAVSSEIVITANFREWRLILSIRTEKNAQWEIREISRKILERLVTEAPAVFGDLLD
ncbi:MAG: FAD-dependent thymidylate synthase [Nitrospinota bacterium]|nr:FAD-dependent thymidylate synthase [Nitrospinota bacterium]